MLQDCIDFKILFIILILFFCHKSNIHDKFQFILKTTQASLMLVLYALRIIVNKFPLFWSSSFYGIFVSTSCLTQASFISSSFTNCLFWYSLASRLLYLPFHNPNGIYLSLPFLSYSWFLKSLFSSPSTDFPFRISPGITTIIASHWTLCQLNKFVAILSI